MYSDASGNSSLGFGALCGPEWTYGQWDKNFNDTYDPSIEYLELFGVTVAVLNWIKLFSNKRIILVCDNESVVHMINSLSSKCKNCMVLIRIIMAESLLRNVSVYAKHVRTEANGKADALSRLDFDRFWGICDRSSMNSLPSTIPVSIWPISKIWQY